MTSEITEASTTDKPLRHDGYAHISPCEGIYASDYCLNGGTCYVHKYLHIIVYACECASHFHGDRCEEKQLEGSYRGGMTLRDRRSNRRGRRRRSRMFNVLLSFVSTKFRFVPVEDTFFLLIHLLCLVTFVLYKSLILKCIFNFRPGSFTNRRQENSSNSSSQSSTLFSKCSTSLTFRNQQ